MNLAHFSVNLTRLWMLLVLILLSFVQMSCSSTIYRKTFRLEENLNKQDISPEYIYRGSKDFNRMSNVMEGWDINISIWSMADHYSGKGNGRNKYRTEVFNLSPLVHPPNIGMFSSIGFPCNDSLIEGGIFIDTIRFTFLPSEETNLVTVDSSVFKYDWIWCEGIVYQFNIITISSKIERIKINFNAKLVDENGEVVAVKDIEKELVRYESKGKGVSWWNRKIMPT